MAHFTSLSRRLIDVTTKAKNRVYLCEGGESLSRIVGCGRSVDDALEYRRLMEARQFTLSSNDFHCDPGIGMGGASVSIMRRWGKNDCRQYETP